MFKFICTADIDMRMRICCGSISALWHITLLMISKIVGTIFNDLDSNETPIVQKQDDWHLAITFAAVMILIELL